MKNCKECSKEFEPENSKGIFCSDKCRQKDYRKKMKAELQKFRSGEFKIPAVGDTVPGGGVVINAKQYADAVDIHVVPNKKRKTEYIRKPKPGETIGVQSKTVQGAKDIMAQGKTKEVDDFFKDVM